MCSSDLGTDVRVVLETVADDGTPPPAPAPVAEEAPDDPHTREEEFVRNLVETLDATEEEFA